MDSVMYVCGFAITLAIIVSTEAILENKKEKYRKEVK